MAKKKLSQTDVPSYSLAKALKVPEVLFESYAGDATDPMDVAEALDQSPKGSTFRMITGAAIAYGLIDGGAQSASISPTSLAEMIFRPTEEGQDLAAKREAFIKPRVINEFLTKYDGNLIPKDSIAVNVLEKMGVPREKTKAVFDDIVEGATELGLTKEIKSKLYVRLQGGDPPRSEEGKTETDTHTHQPKIEDEVTNLDSAVIPSRLNSSDNLNSDAERDSRAKRVFITHGKNKALVAVIKRFLSFGEMEPIVSVEQEATSVPVPEKVMSDMRSCGAAIIHVTDEKTLVDTQGKEEVVLNPNVLIEIGAAMALYGNRFILLVKKGVQLPSNLQGLYRVEYQGDDLGSEGTMKLLSAIDEMKKLPLKTLR